MCELSDILLFCWMRIMEIRSSDIREHSKSGLKLPRNKSN